MAHEVKLLELNSSTNGLLIGLKALTKISGGRLDVPVLEVFVLAYTSNCIIENQMDAHVSPLCDIAPSCAKLSVEARMYL